MQQTETEAFIVDVQYLTLMIVLCLYAGSFCYGTGVLADPVAMHAEHPQPTLGMIVSKCSKVGVKMWFK